MHHPRPRPHRSRRRITVIAVATASTVLSLLPALTAPAAARTLPFGKLEKLRQFEQGFHVTGWAIDPDTAGPAHVYVRVDGKRVATLTANKRRPDIAKQHPGMGVNLGFDGQITEAAGQHRICVAVADPGHRSITLSCRDKYLDHDPIGAITSVTQGSGKLTVSGWAIDRDDPTGARQVSLRIDHERVAGGLADAPVPGLADTHKLAGPNHGITFTVPITQGTHSVCLKSKNAGDGSPKVVDCQRTAVNFSPVGKLARVIQVPGGVRVIGWSSDSDKPSAAVLVTVTADGKRLGTAPADGNAGTHPGHAFNITGMFGGTQLAAGARTVCVVARNLGPFGKNRVIGCKKRTFDWDPTSAVEHVSQHSPGALVTGWAVDPDTSQPIKVAITGDGKQLATVTADGATGSHPGHMFSAVVPLSDGSHNVCASGVNVDYGTADAPASCQKIRVNFDPYGGYGVLRRAKGSTAVVAVGWAIDPDTTKPIDVNVSVDGHTPVTATANIPRPDIAKLHPGTGLDHGFAIRVPATQGEHRVCAGAVNVKGGSKATVSLGCKMINAVHPDVPSAPTGVTAVGGYGGARVVWKPPASDGGAPWTGYTVKALPSGPSVKVDADVLATTVYGLKSNTRYTFAVVANNVAGSSPQGVSNAIRTPRQPPAQTTPAPISTSRYIRNISGASSRDRRIMRREGAADAAHNPSGHAYLSILAVGGQDERDQGVILSAGIRFVSYADLVTDLRAYVTGYANNQRPSAPATIAIATNNDIDVSRSSGVSFANHIIDPVRNYAHRFPGIIIAGSDDMEPGFRATYSQTRHWMQGYLVGTSAPFVFSGSADGCSWSGPNGSCNNGWTARGLYFLAGGASPLRMINLPQIYNTTMAQQWRYISLTGVDAGRPRVNFGGALTEWTACRQAGTCGSLTAVTAWKTMWSQLRAEPKLRPRSLPYSTDLRIDS